MNIFFLEAKNVYELVANISKKNVSLTKELMLLFSLGMKFTEIGENQFQARRFIKHIQEQKRLTFPVECLVVEKKNLERGHVKKVSLTYNDVTVNLWVIRDESISRIYYGEIGMKAKGYIFLNKQLAGYVLYYNHQIKGWSMMDVEKFRVAMEAERKLS